MEWACGPSVLRGHVRVPGSKSHTIRALVVAALAHGQSRIVHPLEAGDTHSAASVLGKLGAGIEASPGLWRVTGTAGRPNTPHDVLDVGNSGTTLRTAMGVCSLLGDGLAVLTGDEQIRRRPAGPLIQSLCDLGADVRSTRGNGCAPLVVAGRLRGGHTTLDAVTSQYLTSLLLSTPLADGDSTIRVARLNEQPYVHITMDWLDRKGIRYEHDGLREFRVPGGQQYRVVDRRIPADWSSGTFFLAAGALGENDVTVVGLDANDTQGDRAVLEYLRQMGARVDAGPDGIRVRGGGLTGTELDLNATPDALPMMAVLACFADGVTTLANVPQARLKETDRIAVMHRELSRMGGRVRELPDGLVVEPARLRGAHVSGHGDHRVVMALAVAGMACEGRTSIETAESAQITFPTFLHDMRALGADLDGQDADANRSDGT